MATSSSSILEVVQHYQRSIERCEEDDEERLLHCITKLYKVPIKVEHLQETGIGKTVNSLRKFNGEIGVAAKALVTKWKAMVAAEEEPMETNCTSAEDEVNNATNGRRSSDDDQFDDNRNNRTESREPHRQEQKSTDDGHHSAKEKDRHRRKEGGSSSSSKHTEHRHESSSRSKPNSSQDHEKKATEKHHKSRERSDKSEHKRREEKRDKDEASTSSHHKSTSSSSSSKRKEETSSDGHHSSKEKSERKESRHRGEHDKHSSSKDKDKHGSRKTKEEIPDKAKTSSKDKEHQAKEKPSSSKQHASATSTSHSSSSTSASERKRSHHTVEESVESKSPNAKIAKVQKVPNNNNNNNNNNNAEGGGGGGGGDDGIDSSMGANFADVLGMLNMPTKKSKKSLANTSKSPVAASTSASTSKENSNKSLSSSKMNGSKLFSSPAAVTTSTYSPDVKPDLLSSTAKLEPLDPNIALELPHITTNYKPLPRNQTVMDCVFNTNTSSASRPMRTLTDAEAYSHGISSKTMRTKIYSGVRTGQILQVPSLFDLCIRVLQKNIDALEYTGGVPFEVLRSVLERATPHQLLVFEEYNPYLMEDSDVLWQLHVQRTYRAHKRQEMESWREMFLRCQEDQERKLSILAESIKQSQKIIAAPVRKTQLAFVDSMVKPPRNVQRKQEQYGTKSKLIATPASRVASLSSVTPNAAKTGDTRLRIAAATARDPAQVSHSSLRQKKAPLMAKTLQFMRRKR